ncbi:MAG: PqqD family protein [Pyrinomonadaceae bacterium]|nr:PqqD family protein [Pyrinomonadaceae bacterium]
MNNLLKAKTKDIVVQELESEVLIFNLKTNQAFCLNESSALVWQLCNGKNSFSEIRRLSGEKLDQKVDDEFIWLALTEIKKNGLLENPEELSDRFKGLNRRQIIKKIGLTSMIALPFISAMVAPSAVMAQSGCSSINGTCAPNGLSITCNVNFANCDGALFNGCESNLLLDVLNCGSCGMNCSAFCAPMNAQCVFGNCVCV